MSPLPPTRRGQRRLASSDRLRRVNVTCPTKSIARPQVGPTFARRGSDVWVRPGIALCLPDGEAEYTGAIARGLAGLRIAYSRDCDVFPVDPQVAEVLDTAGLAFEEAGAEVEELRLALDRPLQDLFDAIQTAFRSHDLLLTSAVAVPPVDTAGDRDTVGPSEVNGIAVDPLIGWCPTFLINFTGHPAASIPAGLTQDGLPVGLQIVGRQLDDASVLAASAAFECLRPWQET